MRNSFTQYDSRAMLIALAVTLAIHLSLAAGVIWGGWLESGATGTPAHPREVLVLVNLSARVPEPEKIKEKNTFVPVDPKTATPEPPKKPIPLFFNANSRATQEEPAKGEQPQLVIDGKNDFIPGSINHPTPPTQTQPSDASKTLSPVDLHPKKIIRNPAATIALNPAGTSAKKRKLAALSDPLEPANVLGQPVPLKPETALPGQPRPPTLAEAKQHLTAGMQANRKIKQNGGAQRKGPASLNVRLTGYGDYDARFVNAVRLAWMQYRAKPGWFQPRTVMVQFKLHHDGTITDLAVGEKSAKTMQAYYCRQALEIPAPFAKWTDTMRREIGVDFRQCHFTFRYLLQ